MTKKTKSEELVKTSKHCKIFKLYKDNQDKVVIVVGNQIVCSRKFDTYWQAEEYIESKPYDLILTTSTLNAHFLYLKLKSDENKINKKDDNKSK